MKKPEQTSKISKETHILYIKLNNFPGPSKKIDAVFSVAQQSYSSEQYIVLLL